MNPQESVTSSQSSAGAGRKTWLVERLQASLNGQAARLSLDDFYRDRSHLPPARRTRVNFDHLARSTGRPWSRR